MRALARWGITPLLAAPLGASALGLGDIELHSALNQPFQARIALVATPDELQGLKVGLASPDTFDRYGLDHPSFLSRLQFRVVTERSGMSSIDISSRESIAEPFVTILVEATWSRGRRLREYTVLLDPPVLLPAPATAPAVQPAQTRPSESNAGGSINRAQQPARPAPQPTPPRSAPAPAPTSAPTPTTTRVPPRTPAATPSGSYGPVQRSETLWAIAEQHRPSDVSMNQMMVAIYEANPRAFGGNMNLLLVGSTLRLPEGAAVEQLAVADANAEVQKQNDEWQNRVSGRLRLVPTETAAAAAPESTPARAPGATPPAPSPAAPAAAANATAPQPNPNAAAAPGAEAGERPLAVRNDTLQGLQQQSAGASTSTNNTEAGAATPAAPAVDLGDDKVFTDDKTEPAAEPAAPAASEAPATPAAPQPAAPVSPPAGPSIASQALAWLAAPIVWIGLGVAALLFAALWYVRRKRQEPEDVTGRWEALEAEVDDDQVREATARLRRAAPEESIVVEEQARPRRGDAAAEAADEPRRGARRAERAPAAPPPADETLSSQTVINLDQADPVAEADFHMAYGLYDQAAELIQKALEAAPTRRDLKLKLLEVYFVWGNKEAFLKTAQTLRAELGDASDPDWAKVVIMGKQLCPDERLFSEATPGAARVDVDLEAGDAPLDLAFDDASVGGVDLDLGEEESGLDFDLESSATRKQERAPTAPAQPKRGRAGDKDDLLDIGERTAAGLEAALFEPEQPDAGSATTPDLSADSLAVTQESPTIESQRGATATWARVAPESPTTELAGSEAPTIETPTIETAGPDAPTMETPTIETRRTSEPPTVEQPRLSASSQSSDNTSEIHLDDLGLDVSDFEDLPQDLGELPGDASSDSDTRQQPALVADDEDQLLSATGVTQVLRAEEDDEDVEQRKTAVLGDEDATMLAPGYGDNTMTGTEVLEHRFELDEESGDTSLVKALRRDDDLDLNLDDLSAALHGGDTVEQPRTSPFSGDVFGGGDTPLDLDVGSDLLGQDEPTGTEEANPLDPQTMTEVGTKLDLARAYIDMGDPEGARSILEEVLDEGDPGQRREAQSLIDVLSA